MMYKMRIALQLITLFALLGTVTGQDITGVRLVGGNQVYAGRVEIRYLGFWGTICNNNWDAKDATVICKMLGYPTGGYPLLIGPDTFGPANEFAAIHLEDVQCTGNEILIEDCGHRGLGVGGCTHNEDAGVVCVGNQVTQPPTTTPTTTTTTQPPRICNNPSQDVRLQDGPNEAVGRVQIRQNSNSPWGEICDDRWGQEDARVICRMLCFNPDNSRALLGGSYGDATQDFLLDDLQCGGEEVNIFNCPANPQDHNCAPAEAAAISCMEDDPTDRPLPSPEIDCVVPEDRIVAKFSKNAETGEPRLEERHLTLTNGAEESCGYITSSDSDFVTISIPFIGCGTEREINFTHIMYLNRVHYDVPPPDNLPITRNDIYDIQVICLMGRNGDPDEEVDPESLTPAPAYGEGHPDLQVKLFHSNKFEREREDQVVLLGEWVYAAVVLTTTDPDLKVVVQECFTTPGEDRDSEPRYFLIQDKCAAEPSMVFYPVNDTLFGFRFQAFQYYEGEFDLLYLHCKGIVCDLDEKTGRCDRSCGVTDAPTTTEAGNRKRREAEEEVSFSAQISSYFSSLLRRKRQISPFSGTVMEGDEGPIYIINPYSEGNNDIVTPSNIIPSTPRLSTSTPSTLSTTDSANEEVPNEVNEVAPEQSNGIQGDVVQDDASSATSVCKHLLSAVISMLLALLVL